MRGTGPAKRVRSEAEKQRMVAEMLDMYLVRKMTYRAIGRHYGLTHATISTWITGELKRNTEDMKANALNIVLETNKTVLAGELAIFKKSCETCSESQVFCVHGDLSAKNNAGVNALKTSQELSKLMALYAPTKVEHSGTISVDTPIDAEMKLLTEELGLLDPSLSQVER